MGYVVVASAEERDVGFRWMRKILGTKRGSQKLKDRWYRVTTLLKCSRRGMKLTRNDSGPGRIQKERGLFPCIFPCVNKSDVEKERVQIVAVVKRNELNYKLACGIHWMDLVDLLCSLHMYEPLFCSSLPCESK